MAITATLNPDRILVAAADRPALYLLDGPDGRVLDRQALDEPPSALVWLPSRGRSLILFHRSSQICEAYPFRERTLASCFEPGVADVGDTREKVPVVLGAIEDRDGNLVVAIAKLDDPHRPIRLRRFGFNPTAGRWHTKAESPWISLEARFEYAGPWPMAAVEGPLASVWIAVPGAGRLLRFGPGLDPIDDTALGRDPRAMLADGERGVVYVADATLGEVMKVATESREIVARVHTGPGVESVVLDRAHQVLWVGRRHDDALSALALDDLTPRWRVRVDSGVASLALLPGSMGVLAADSSRGIASRWPMAKLQRDDPLDRAPADWTTEIR